MEITSGRASLGKKNSGLLGTAEQKSACETSLETDRFKVKSTVREFSQGNFPLLFFQYNCILTIRVLFFKQFRGLHHLIGGNRVNPKNLCNIITKGE